MNENKIINFLFEIASLRRIIRSHRQLIASANDNVGDHSSRVAIIGMILAKMENCDENKVMKTCLFHDLAEARTGDANFVNKFYGTLRHTEAIKDQTEDLPIGDEIRESLKDFGERRSKESIVAKDADNLDQMLLQQEYFIQDEKNSRIWQTHTEKFLITESAKKIAAGIKEANPFDWLYDLAEKKTDEKIIR